MIKKIKKITTFFTKHLWLVPFLGFLVGYNLSHYFLQRTDLVTPNIIGKNIQSAAVTLAQQRLGLRLLAERDDTARPEGTILEQIPQPQQTIRPNQNIFVTVSRRPTPRVAPDFNEKKLPDIEEQIKKMGLELKVIYLKSNYPKHSCIAQYPQAGSELINKKITVYLAQESDLLYIMPNLGNKTLTDLESFLQKNNVEKSVFHAHEVDQTHTCDQCRIVDQSPAAGSIVDINKTLSLNLQVQ